MRSLSGTSTSVRFILGAGSAAFVALGLVACGPGSPSDPIDADVTPPTDASVQPDTTQPLIDAPPPLTEHLLLTEIMLTPTLGEFIEIFNPSDRAIDLTNYYLSDDADYYKLPGLSGTTAAPVLDSSDFIARFPAGATIEPNAVVVVAMDFVGFNGQFGAPPDYGLLNASGGAAMRDPGGGVVTLIGDMSTLTNGGEGVVLFHWDGQSDLVQDVDMVQVGTPSAANSLEAKSGKLSDGPDDLANPTPYRTDDFTMGVIGAAAGTDLSHKRIAREGDFEDKNGGNGLIGHDETSEAVQQTWDDMLGFSAPTPGEAHPNLIQ